jgi:hypothetical protein
MGVSAFCIAKPGGNFAIHSLEVQAVLIDSHAHLDSSRYAEDREAMLRRA